MINYSLAARMSNPSDKHSEKKIYATAQARQVLQLGDFARHIASHGSPYTRDVIVGVIAGMSDCLRELLLEGYKVSLGDLGSFYLSLSSDGADSADDFNPLYHIKNVNVRWDKGKNFSDLKQDADFEYVMTREEQRLAKKAAKEALVIPGGDGGDDGGDNGGGDITGGDDQTE